MKKLLYFAFFMNFAFLMPVFATPVCAKDSIVSIILDPYQYGQDSINMQTGTWKSTFSYGTIIGIKTCIDIDGSTEGNYSIDVQSSGNEQKGPYCWCKMTHPMESKWVFFSSYNTTEACVSNCNCSIGYYSRTRTRIGLFNSAQQ